MTQEAGHALVLDPPQKRRDRRTVEVVLRIHLQELRRARDAHVRPVRRPVRFVDVQDVDRVAPQIALRLLELALERVEGPIRAGFPVPAPALGAQHVGRVDVLQRIAQHLLRIAVQGSGVQVVDPQLQRPPHDAHPFAGRGHGRPHEHAPESELRHLQTRPAQAAPGDGRGHRPRPLRMNSRLARTESILDLSPIGPFCSTVIQPE